MTKKKRNKTLWVLVNGQFYSEFFLFHLWNTLSSQSMNIRINFRLNEQFYVQCVSGYKGRENVILRVPNSI